MFAKDPFLPMEVSVDPDIEVAEIDQFVLEICKLDDVE